MNTPYFVLTNDFGTPEYDEIVALRTEVLRKPLGLEFTEEFLSKEYADVHFGCYANGSHELLACAMLHVKTEGEARMKQVAVKPSLQGTGVGSFLVGQFEAYCKENGFRSIALHARDTAVDFYLKLGYIKEGEEFEEVTIKHWAMRKSL